MKQSYFIIGTDTNVGKTYVASLLIQQFVAAGYQTVGMKPIASGCAFDAKGELINDDVQALNVASNVSAPLNLINPYHFSPAIAPHIAAELAGISMQIELIQQAYAQLTKLAEVVIVEGAGGFFVPINATLGRCGCAIANTDYFSDRHQAWLHQPCLTHGRCHTSARFNFSRLGRQPN